jgi:hypothetical protein
MKHGVTLLIALNMKSGLDPKSYSGHLLQATLHTSTPLAQQHTLDSMNIKTAAVHVYAAERMYHAYAQFNTDHSLTPAVHMSQPGCSCSQAQVHYGHPSYTPKKSERIGGKRVSASACMLQCNILPTSCWLCCGGSTRLPMQGTRSACTVTVLRLLEHY